LHIIIFIDVHVVGQHPFHLIAQTNLVVDYLYWRPPEKTRLLLEEVLMRPVRGAHPVVCVGPNAPV